MQAITRRGWKIGVSAAILFASTTPSHGATFSILWDAPEDAVIGYRVYRATSSSGPYTLLKTVSTTSTRVEVPTGETRCYRIRAVDDLGQASELSGFVCLTITREMGE